MIKEQILGYPILNPNRSPDLVLDLFILGLGGIFHMHLLSFSSWHRKVEGINSYFHWRFTWEKGLEKWAEERLEWGYPLKWMVDSEKS